MLLVLAATGVLRGLQDTRTPLVVAVAGNLANIALNLLLVYGVGLAGLGIAGSAHRHRPRPDRLGRRRWSCVVRARRPARAGAAAPATRRDPRGRARRRAR